MIGVVFQMADSLSHCGIWVALYEVWLISRLANRV